MNLVQLLREMVLSKKYTYVDTEIGLLRRLGGYWRVEHPKSTIGVAVKIFGSDRFGPNKKALNSYKKFYREEFSLIWSEAKSRILSQLEQEGISWYNAKLELIPLEIIFGDPKMQTSDMSIAFSISEVVHNEFYVELDKGKFKEFGGMYCYHES